MRRLEEQREEREAEQKQQGSGDQSGDQVDRHVAGAEQDPASLDQLLLDQVVPCQLGKRR